MQYLRDFLPAILRKLFSKCAVVCLICFSFGTQSRYFFSPSFKYHRDFTDATSFGTVDTGHGTGVGDTVELQHAFLITFADYAKCNYDHRVKVAADEEEENEKNGGKGISSVCTLGFYFITIIFNKVNCLAMIIFSCVLCLVSCFTFSTLFVQ